MDAGYHASGPGQTLAGWADSSFRYDFFDFQKRRFDRKSKT